MPETILVKEKAHSNRKLEINNDKTTDHAEHNGEGERVFRGEDGGGGAVNTSTHSLPSRVCVCVCGENKPNLSTSSIVVVVRRRRCLLKIPL